MMMTSYQWWGYQQGDCEWGDVRGCLRGFGGTTVVRGGGYIQVSCRNSLDELLGGGMIGEWETGGKFL